MKNRLMMTSAQVVKTSVNVITNSPSQDYTHPDDRTLPSYNYRVFKPFTVKTYIKIKILNMECARFITKLFSVCHEYDMGL